MGAFASSLLGIFWNRLIDWVVGLSGGLTVLSISLVCAAEMQKRARDSMMGVAGKPTTTVPMFLFNISRPNALKNNGKIICKVRRQSALSTINTSWLVVSLIFFYKESVQCVSNLENVNLQRITNNSSVPLNSTELYVEFHHIVSLSIPRSWFIPSLHMKTSKNHHLLPVQLWSI